MLIIKLAVAALSMPPYLVLHALIKPDVLGSIGLGMLCGLAVNVLLDFLASRQEAA